MSHVCEIQIEIKDLDALAVAAGKLGLEMRRGQKTYRWYNRYMGDYKLADGMRVEDLGKCDHALSIPGNAQAYEVGVRRRLDGKFTLVWDFWSGGFGLEAKIGKDASKLRQRYAAEVAIKNARRQGFRVTEQAGQDGKIKLVCRR